MSTFDIVTSSFQVRRRSGSPATEASRVGFYTGLSAVAFCLVGAYVLMDKRPVIEDWLTLSETFLAVTGIVGGWFSARAAKRAGAVGLAPIGHGALGGLIAGLMIAVLVVLVNSVNLRTVLVAASPMLLKALSFGAKAQSFQGTVTLIGIGAILGFIGGFLFALPKRLGRPLAVAGATVIAAGLFRDVVASILLNIPVVADLEPVVFGQAGVMPGAALVIFVGAAVLDAVRETRRIARAGRARTVAERRMGLVALIAGILIVPLITNDFVAQVAMLVGLYVLMGMGLNIELGLAGLVDLGFVAFFAVGAYTVALLTSNGPEAIAHWSFWAALPMAVLFAAISGLIFGLPVLRVRGDYLAMATLGLGEIVRVLVVSEAMKPVLGGSQGIIEIARPTLFGHVMNTPVELYYLALVLAAFVGFVSWRLQHSRTGRAWLAIREDEDVAQALGIDLVAVKLLAYTVGAAFAGAAGAVFAALVGSVYPHSFQLVISINVLAILVIGGLGSLPGVVVGSLALIGLPELLREFGEYRYLFYGLALVVMMHVKAEGLWPAAANRETKSDAR